MGKSQETFNKKEKEKKRLKKRQEKQLKKEERRANSDGGGLENMMAYLDEDGNITSTPPDPTKKKKVIKASSIEIGVPKREDLGEPGANEGKVTFYNDSKGYGFIKDVHTSENYFFHVNGVLEEVVENDVVTYILERGQKGMVAVQVKKVVIVAVTDKETDIKTNEDANSEKNTDSEETTDPEETTGSEEKTDTDSKTSEETDTDSEASEDPEIEK